MISVISVVGGWDVMVTDMTASIYVWCIDGDISTFPVGDATATMTPDGNALFFLIFFFCRHSFVYLFPSPA